MVPPPVCFTEITLSSEDVGSFCKPLNSSLLSFETFDSDYAISQIGRFSDFPSKLFVLYGLKQDLYRIDKLGMGRGNQGMGLRTILQI